MTFPGLVDQLTILPCTQERVAGLNYFEPEQQPATNGKKIVRDDMYNLWRMNKTVDQVFDENDGRKRALSFGDIKTNNSFQSYFSGSSKCKNINTADKWKMYAQYINKSAINNIPTTCVIVSHHNRMKKKGNTFDTTDPLIPLTTKEKAKANPDCNKDCNAYANNFTVRIEIPEPDKNDEIKIEIVDPGFPDKGAFATTEACENDTGEPDDTSQGGGKKYLYCTKDSSNEIDVGKLQNWLENAFSSSGQNGEVVQKGKVVIYFIRHGNSIHNKPTKQKMEDSSLTYLGMIQAAQLGYNIAKYKQDNLNLCADFINSQAQPTVLLCGSFLSRTQLTGLIFLASLYRSCTQAMPNTNTINNIKEVLINGDKCFDKRLKGAWVYLMKTAVKNQQANYSKIDKYIGYEPLQSIITNGDYTQVNPIYEELVKKYPTNNIGGRKTRKHKRKSRKMTRKVRVKRASKRVNKKASKKGHKKRSKRVRKM